MMLKDRLLKGWTARRVLYLVIGGGLVVVSIRDHQWFGVVIGTYFAAMGFFAFGCAAGHCGGGACVSDPVHQPDSDR